MLFRGRFGIGAFVAMSQWINGAVRATQQLGWMQRDLSRCWAQLALYLDLLKQPPTIQVVADAIRPERLGGGIEFREVTFVYEPRKKSADGDDKTPKEPAEPVTALHNVSFIIRPGQKIALVGESGAGKSTVAYALMRANDPQSGSILLDGLDLRQLDLEAVRQRIGYVPQKPQLFDNTLRYNLTFGLNGNAGDITDAQLIEALTMVKLEKLAEDSGLDGKLGEHGHTLSGGERQRVCIARALLKKPDVLVFDEATSALDPATEKKVQIAIDEIRTGTLLIIAHRYSTIRHVDRILVFDAGRLVDDGTHDELMDNSPYYQALLEQQLIQ
jgi:ABC-type multidrug transport system fused ATPase/permease subunit